MLKQRDSETRNFFIICFAFFFLSIASIVTEDGFQLFALILAQPNEFALCFALDSLLKSSIVAIDCGFVALVLLFFLFDFFHCFGFLPNPREIKGKHSTISVLSDSFLRTLSRRVGL
ncbi:hypothetical protein AtNW77_Chr5g0099331 [Arabidopsis thaliana]